jgi:hypothetical protein
LPDYQINFPDEWIALSPDKITELRQLNNYPDRFHMTGYTGSDTSLQQTPYIICFYSQTDGIENLRFRDILKMEIKRFQKDGHTADFTIDSIHYKFYTTVVQDGLQIFYGYCIGGKGIVYLQYFSNPAIHEKDSLLFSAIIGSAETHVKFKDSYAVLEKMELYKKKGGEYATYAFVLALVIIGINYLRKRLFPEI